MTREHEEQLLETSALHLLHRVAQCAEDLFERNTAHLDITPRQFAVLIAVANAEGLSQTELVAITGIDRSTLADLVQRMIRKGLLKRQRSRTDARAYAVKLTDHGLRAIRAAMPIAQRVDETLLSLLPVARGEEFVSCLGSIVRELGSPR
jgi:DNA-binding MarR family transcriptional regulator